MYFCVYCIVWGFMYLNKWVNEFLKEELLFNLFYMRFNVVRWIDFLGKDFILY